MNLFFWSFTKAPNISILSGFHCHSETESSQYIFMCNCSNGQSLELWLYGTLTISIPQMLYKVLAASFSSPFLGSLKYFRVCNLNCVNDPALTELQDYFTDAKAFYRWEECVSLTGEEEKQKAGSLLRSLAERAEPVAVAGLAAVTQNAWQG